METSCQLLQIHEEITSLTKQKEAIERRIKEKQYEEADLCKINLCFIKIIQKTKGADNYSSEKQGVKPCTPPKKKCSEPESPSTSSCPSCEVTPESLLVSSFDALYKWFKLNLNFLHVLCLIFTGNQSILVVSRNHC